MNITDYIPFGKENAITRKRLSAITHLPDRKVRTEIERARRRAIEDPNADCILVEYDGRGYWRTNDTDEIERCYRREFNRWMNQYQSTLKPLRDRLKAAGRKT